MLPLSFAEKDRPYKIVKITGRDSVRTHLHSLGLIENEPICIRQILGGSVIIEVKGIRIALDQNMAKRIMI